MNKRLVDHRRPVYWFLAGFFSDFHRGQWEARHLPTMTRVAIRLTHYQPDLKFIFHHNAKAASTTTTRLLERVLARRRAALPEGERGTESELLTGPAHWREILPRLHDPEVFRFSFVRHPVARAVSTFNNFFVETQNAYTRRHRFTRRSSGLKLYDPSLENFDRFLDFSEEVIAADPDLCDLHIRTQRRNLLVGFLHYDRIAKMESFDEEIVSIFHQIGLSKWLLPEDLHKKENVSRTSNRLRRPSEQQIERLCRIYAEDFEEFGYPAEPFWDASPSNS